MAAIKVARPLHHNVAVEKFADQVETLSSAAPNAHAPTHKLGGSDTILLNEFGNPTDSVQFSQQQSLQFRIENRTTDPSSPAVGEIWLRTDI